MAQMFAQTKISLEDDEHTGQPRIVRTELKSLLHVSVVRPSSGGKYIID
jgi:hypothetical protein